MWCCVCGRRRARRKLLLSPKKRLSPKRRLPKRRRLSPKKQKRRKLLSPKQRRPLSLRKRPKLRSRLRRRRRPRKRRRRSPRKRRKPRKCVDLPRSSSFQCSLRFCMCNRPKRQPQRTKKSTKRALTELCPSSLLSLVQLLFDSKRLPTLNPDRDEGRRK